jgi:transposase
LRGDFTIAEFSRRESISENLYYRWSKYFLEAGKSRLIGDTKREANNKKVKTLRIYKKRKMTGS